MRFTFNDENSEIGYGLISDSMPNYKKCVNLLAEKLNLVWMEQYFSTGDRSSKGYLFWYCARKALPRKFKLKDPSGIKSDPFWSKSGQPAFFMYCSFTNNSIARSDRSRFEV
jgi:hypothetical protein